MWKLFSIHRAGFLVLACSLFVALPLGAQDQGTPEDLLEQVKDFDRYYSTFKDQASQIEAIRALAGVDCPEAAASLSRLLSDKDPEIVRAALEVMSDFIKKETLSPILAVIPKNKDKAIMARLIEVLGRAKFTAACPIFIEVLEKEKDLSVRLRIAEAFGQFEDKRAVPSLNQMLLHKKPQMRIAALDSLGKIRDRKNSPVIVPLLKDKDWRVRAAAVNAAKVIRIVEAVDSLIDLLSDDSGRIKMEAVAALWDITDSNYGEDQKMWREKWAWMNKQGFNMPSDAEMAKRKAKRKAAAIRYKGWKKTTTYHGIPTTSKRMLFIIDVSGSMDDLVVDREKFKDGGYASFQKLEIVKTELLRTIENLQGNTFFNIFAFATKVKKWKKGLVRANIVSRRAAVSWVKNLRPLGSSRDMPVAGGMGAADGQLAMGKTNSLGALLVAFGLPADKITSERKLEKMGKPKNDLDTIFFLSDGRPSTGLFIDREDILREVVKANKYRKVVLHTIAIGEFQKAFLMMLANQNGGEFVDLGR